MKVKFVATGVLATLFAFPMMSHAYNACQCVQYIKNRVGDQSPAGHAYYMDNYLKKNGYRLVDLNHDIPRNKDIFIIRQDNPWNYGKNPKTGAKYGHVAIVSSAMGQAGSHFYVDLVSANMNDTAWSGRPKANPRYPERSEYNCDNVSGNVLNVNKSQYRSIAVYRRD